MKLIINRNCGIAVSVVWCTLGQGDWLMFIFGCCKETDPVCWITLDAVEDRSCYIVFKLLYCVADAVAVEDRSNLILNCYIVFPLYLFFLLQLVDEAGTAGSSLYIAINHSCGGSSSIIFCWNFLLTIWQATTNELGESLTFYSTLVAEENVKINSTSRIHWVHGMDRLQKRN